jgi:hypothetical protein
MRLRRHVPSGPQEDAMFRKIALTLFVLIAVAAVAIFAIASTRPATYHIERSTTTAAAPATVYAVVNDLHRFPNW